MTNERFKRNKYKRRIVTEALYKKWITEYPEYKDYTIQEFKKYWVSLANKYMDIAVTNPHGVRLPFYMGDLSVQYTPKLDKNISIHKTAKQGIEVKHMNFSTNGKAGKTIWSVDHARKFNKYVSLMGFEGSRRFIKKTTNQLTETPEIFRDSARSKSNRLYMLKKLKEND